MNFKYDQKNKTNNKSSLLSATKQQTILSVNKVNKQANLKTCTKAILKVYVDEENLKKYVEAAIAYALGLTNVRAIMTGNDRYKEITDDKINQVKERNYDIEFVSLPRKNKQKIQIFYEDNKYFIGSVQLMH